MIGSSGGPNPPSSTAPAVAPNDATAGEGSLNEGKPADLKQRTARGAVISAGSQVATLVFRMGSMMIMARLLLPQDFGLIGMVTAFTGFLSLFRDAGLSMATIQRATITNAQTSTLFWINLAVGGLLAALAAIGAPILATFYGEPRLLWVTVALGSSFIFNGGAAQHRAMLQRNMRFGTLATIDIASLILGTVAGIGAALAGLGYWALVVMTTAYPAVVLLGVWWATRWIPGLPQRGAGVRSMLWFGGTITLNSVVVYLAYNADKVLIGKVCGAEALGIYGRAYQLINLPTESLNTTLGSVAFPVFARVQEEPERLRRYFLRGYSLFLTLVMPITMACALFAADIVRVFLGEKWHEAAQVFRLMAPTIIAFALVNPLAWLMLAVGKAGRSLKIAFLIAPVVVLSYVIGLSKGPNGVAAGFSIAMTLLVVPIIWWAKHGTLVRGKDIAMAVLMPLLAILVGAAVVLATNGAVGRVQPTLVRLILESSILFGVYLFVLLFVMKQKATYLQLLRDTGLWPRSSRARE